MAAITTKRANRIDRQFVGVGAIDDSTEFARRVRDRMRELGLTHQQLAQRARISRQTLFDALNPPPVTQRTGRRHYPRLETLVTLAYHLQVHPFWLVEGLFSDIHVPSHLRAQVEGDRGSYVGDVDTPDGMLVAPGARFMKTWTVQNLGNVTWEGCKLVCIDEHITMTSNSTGQVLHAARLLTPDVKEIPVPLVRPGEIWSTQVWFTAPTTSGTVISYWVGVLPDGSPMYDESAGVWVSVNVTTLADTVGFRPMR